MEKIQLNIQEQNLLEFEAEISGISTEQVDVRLIIESDGIDLTFKGKMNGNTVSFDIPILSKMVKPDEYTGSLEFIIEGEKYFKPMTAIFEMVSPVEINVKPTTVTESKKQIEKKQKVSENVSFGSIRVTSKGTLLDRLEENLEKLAKAKNVDEMLSIYNQNVLLKESADTNPKDALELIEQVCLDVHKKTFKEYIKEVSE